MSDFYPSNCVTLSELALYYAGALEELQMAQIDDHMLGCPYCLALSEQVALNTQSILEEEWQSARGLEFLQGAVASPAIAGLPERFRRWIETGADLAVQVALPHLTQSVAAFVLSGLDRMVSTATPFRLAEAISSGDRGGDAMPAHGQILQIPGPGRLAARVFVDPNRKLISVQVDSVARQTRPPLVAIHCQQAGTIGVQEMTQMETPAGDPLLVDLITDFEYHGGEKTILVLLEPLEQ